MIESAIIALPFFLLVFGLIEYALLFGTTLSSGNVTTTAARQAAVQGDWPTADYFILKSVNESAHAVDRDAIETIVIWEAAGPDEGEPPAGCLDGTGVTDLCNVYEYEDLGWLEFDFDCDSATPGPPDDDWCASDRKSFLADDGTGYGTDFVGIYVRMRHTFITGFFGDSLTIESATVVRVEPTSINDD